jgi:hypothetical protein
MKSKAALTGAGLQKKAGGFSAPLHKPAVTGGQGFLHSPTPGISHRRHLGNGAMQRMLDAGAVQAKLKIGPANDKYEQEADRLADKVMRLSAPAVQRKRKPGCTDCKEEDDKETIRLKPLAQDITPLVRRKRREEGEDAPGLAMSGLNEAGRPLPGSERSFFEDRFGHDFSGVRIHTGASAAQAARSINARAFTYGNHVAFGADAYRPGSHVGDHLMAHELTHVVQQQGGGAAPSVQRSPLDELMGGDPLGMGGPVITLSDLPSDEGAKVQQVVVAHENEIIAFVTLANIYIYHLNYTNVPVGSYETTVKAQKNKVVWDFGETPGVPEEGFHFNFDIDKGQPNPAKLFRGQKTAKVNVVPRVNMPVPSAGKPKCQIAKPPETLIEEAPLDRTLFEKTSKWETLWTKDIPLAEFGWAELSLKAKGSAVGKLKGGYGPGVLDDICLFRAMDNKRYAGEAHFKFPAHISPVVKLEGKLKFSAEYLSVIPVTEAEGTLTATGGADLKAELDAGLEVVYDMKKNKWEFTGSLMMRGGASFRFKADAKAAVKILTRTIWSRKWELVDTQVDLGWEGGFKIKPDFSIEWVDGHFITPGEIGAMARGPADKQSMFDRAVDLEGLTSDFDENSIDFEDQVRAALDDEHSSTVRGRAREGFTEDDALPLRWRKPMNFYPKTVDIPNAIHPKQLDRDDGPTPVTFQERGKEATEKIGVDKRNWPFEGKAFRLIADDRKDTEKDRLKRLLDRLGYSRSGVQIDHVHEIQFGGKDKFHNVWPMSSDANMSAGSRHKAQLDNYRRTLGNISGRWFQVVAIEI